ncbi:MAG TPA: protein translocase subunit SecDF [Bacteroidales bacterium]|nr:protein translocase subunit SecDF [Bacteroidales bacterium]
MQNKGLIRFFAIALAVVSLYQLSFTFIARRVESDARRYAQSEKYVNLAQTMAQGNEIMEGFFLDSITKDRERFYLDSMMNLPVYNLGIASFTFQQVKERELNLGLDLKGGMNVTLEVSVQDVLRVLSEFSADPTFNEALALAAQEQRVRREDYLTLFGESFAQVDPNARLAAIFSTVKLRDRINVNSTNEEVLAILRTEVNTAIDRSFQILRTRIDRFGVAQPNIQMLPATGRILVELPGIKEPERVRRLLQGTARLEFWETFEYSEVFQYFIDINERFRQANVDAVATTDTLAEVVAPAEEQQPAQDQELVDLLAGDTAVVADQADQDIARDNPLFAFLTPAFVQDQAGQMAPGAGPVVGYSAIKDTARVNHLLAEAYRQGLLPRNLRLMWNIKPVRGQENLHELIAIRQTAREGGAPLTGEVVVDARQDYSPTGEVVIDMAMNSEGARTWRRLTADNIGRAIAIVLDGYVYSFPIVQTEIPGGRSQITGQFTITEAQDLANILEAGSMPAPVRIVEEAIVGPSLGREAVQSGLVSFVAAFVLVLLYMLFYYNRAGLVANIALLTNVFFIMGVLASLGATLTLPGIAGIVLTIGMAVDANVIIYERVLEELKAGKGQKLAIADGYKNAYSAIIDGNVTTLLTGIVLNVFGSGPVQGFATTLIIGILTSLFTGVFLTRIVFQFWLDKNSKISFDRRITRGFLANTSFDFIGVRKKFYIISAVVLIVGLGSLVIRGFNMGIDFSGGRSYVVRFDQDVNTLELRDVLEDQFGEAPEVKTFGPLSQVRVTTSYLIDDLNPAADSTAERRLFDGVQPFFATPITFEEFTSDDEAKVLGRMSSQKVGPTVARDIKINAVIAVVIALIIIFAYVAIRFKKWQFGVGGLSSLFHDTLIVMSLYSLLPGLAPWNMDLDQTFIAAILTIIGYSINDTVVIFDRIRENINLFPKRDLKTNVNDALNATLSRTFNTSLTTILVLLIIFIFGGEVIRGFAFALMVGITVGTYSSLFNAAPVAYDLIMRKKKQ